MPENGEGSTNTQSPTKPTVHRLRVVCLKDIGTLCHSVADLAADAFVDFIFIM